MHEADARSLEVQWWREGSESLSELPETERAKMTYDVLVENEQERSYTATLLGWPKLSVSGSTRDEALDELTRTLKRRLAKAEVVTIEVDLPREPNPWIRLAGVYKDHPMFDDLVAEMEADRRELDAEELDSEEAP